MDSGGERGKDDEFSLGHVCGLVEHPRKNFPMTHDYRYLAYTHMTIDIWHIVGTMGLKTRRQEMLSCMGLLSVIYKQKKDI